MTSAGGPAVNAAVALNFTDAFAAFIVCTRVVLLVSSVNSQTALWGIGVANVSVHCVSLPLVIVIRPKKLFPATCAVPPLSHATLPSGIATPCGERLPPHHMLPLLASMPLVSSAEEAR